MHHSEQTEEREKRTSSGRGEDEERTRRGIAVVEKDAKGAISTVAHLDLEP